ncbi:hypothetical protein V2J23_05635 [Geobacillus thermoleovorans]|nr:hypothetical protein [Geobacillus kaustophilus]
MKTIQLACIPDSIFNDEAVFAAAAVIVGSSAEIAGLRPSRA